MHLSLVTLHAAPSAQSVPLAAACIKSYLDTRPSFQSAGLLVSMPDYFPDISIEAILEELVASQVTAVGFPVYIWNHDRVISLSNQLKQRLPDLIIMAGGPEATADPERLLNEAPFDLVVVGEGELTMAEICQRIFEQQSLVGIAGTASKGAGEMVLLPRPQMPSLDALPSPYLMGLLDRYIDQGMVWQLSRGCPFACEFCYDGMGDRSVRRYPLDRLEQELSYFVEHGASQIFALDSTFNTDKKRATTLLRLIEREASDVHFHFEVRHELLDREQANLFAQLTCSLQIGLQSADPQVAGGVGRPFDPESFRRKVMLLNDSGATFGFDLIYGLPNDTLERFTAGLDFALSLYPNHLDIFILSVLPGTKLWYRAPELGMQALNHAPYTLLSTPSFSAEDLERAGRLARGTDIFYSRGKAVAWFNGVCRALSCKPVELIERFADFLEQRFTAVPDESVLSDEAIWQLQRTFLSEQFGTRHAQAAAALDCADYHYAYGVALMAVVPPAGDERVLKGKQLLTMQLIRPSSVTLVSFNYEILDVLDSGEPDPRWIARTLKPVGSYAAIYPARGAVMTESLILPYYQLLERMNGKTTGEVLGGQLGLDPQETLEFLRFAYEEGLLVEPGRVPPQPVCC